MPGRWARSGAVVATASQSRCLEQQASQSYSDHPRAGSSSGPRPPVAAARGLFAAGRRNGRFRLSGQMWETSFSLGAELNFVAAGMEPPSSIPNPYISNCGFLAENENAMPIAFGNELNSSIDQDEVLDPRRRADRAMVPQGQAAPRGASKIECGRRGSTSLTASSKTWRRGSMQPGSRPRQARRRSS